jgi:hypothetical protein
MNRLSFTNGTGEYIKCLKTEIDCFIRQRGTYGKSSNLVYSRPEYIDHLPNESNP